MEEGLLRALAAFGVIAPMLAPIPFTGVHFTAGAEGHYVAPEVGLVEHCVGLGDEVAKGRIVALLHPVAGRSSTPREILSPMPGLCAAPDRTRLRVTNQLIGNIGTPVHS